MNAAIPLPINTYPKELALTGVCQYHLENDLMVVEVEQISNHRQSNSGDLSLEIWALPQPYQGGDFSGYPIAAQALGQLLGQHQFRHLNYRLPLSNPPEGRWNLVMMLREWDNGCWITRDYINFPFRLKAEYTLTLSLETAPASGSTSL